MHKHTHTLTRTHSKRAPVKRWWSTWSQRQSDELQGQTDRSVIIHITHMPELIRLTEVLEHRWKHLKRLCVWAKHCVDHRIVYTAVLPPRPRSSVITRTSTTIKKERKKKEKRKSQIKYMIQNSYLENSYVDFFPPFFWQGRIQCSLLSVTVSASQANRIKKNNNNNKKKRTRWETGDVTYCCQRK